VIRVPNAFEYAAMPFEERRRMVAYLDTLRLSWLETEEVAT
jgi:hypothetical protein